MSTKNNILYILENNKDNHISGEIIADQLNISRNAVWKAIKALEKDGYKINAISNKGYMLREYNDILSVQGISPYLLDKNLKDKIYVHKSLESTNKTAKEMAINGASHGTIVIADLQTGGKGRYGRKFFSPPDCGIYMSIVMRPNELSFTSPTIITAFTAVCVCDAIKSICGVNPKIKWVNDIFLDNKKISGILTEAVTDFETNSIQWIVVGIGINFNTSSEGFPDEILNIAGSIFNGPTNITRNNLIANIVNRILVQKNNLDQNQILEKYKQNMMMIGKKILVQSSKESFEAIAIDIDNIGQLIVKKDNGEIVSLCSGEISIRF